jgi:UDP-N-acetylglucosamine 4,6-dehydratase
MNLKNMNVLVTGGTGSFGSTVVKRLQEENVRSIKIFSRDEKKQDDMRQKLGAPNIEFFIGDTRDYASCLRAVEGADLVFHAAALKQVPSCEFFPEEAVKTNVLGSANVIDACLTHKVKKLVVLSTDKAVMPINAMGISKAMMEKIATARGREARRNDLRTAICVTRYGNVMSSRGSVIPKFVKCIKEKLPVPVTDLTMTRFMMTLEESVDLVFHAFKSSKGGELFVKKADAASLNTLLDALELLFGHPIKYRITGPRHGEKFHETLATAQEVSVAKHIGSFLSIEPDMRDLNYKGRASEVTMSQAMDLASNTVKQLSAKQLAKKILDSGMAL